MGSSPQSSIARFVQMTDSMLANVLIIENQSYEIGWNAQLFKDCINKKYLCQVMMVDDQIVGYYIVQKILDEYHILNLCVTPELQGQGLGKFQLQNILQLAESEAMNRILLEVRVGNRAARKLYTGSGFHIIGKRKNYYPSADNNLTDHVNIREDAHVMELALS